MGNTSTNVILRRGCNRPLPLNADPLWFLILNVGTWSGGLCYVRLVVYVWELFFAIAGVTAKHSGSTHPPRGNLPRTFSLSSQISSTIRHPKIGKDEEKKMKKAC